MQDESLNETPTGVLEDWWVQHVASLDEFIIWGSLYFDEKGRFFDGTLIHTSGIAKAVYDPDYLREGHTVKTRNSTYRLGKKLEKTSTQNALGQDIFNAKVNEILKTGDAQ